MAGGVAERDARAAVCPKEPRFRSERSVVDAKLARTSLSANAS